MKIIYVNCGESNKYGTDLLSIEHILCSCETTAWKKNQVCTGLQPFNYAITLNTLPTELKNQLGAEHYVGFK